MGNGESQQECPYTHGYHILKVQPNSPGSAAGLQSFFDFIVSAGGVLLNNEDRRFEELLFSNVNRNVPLVVYSSKTNTTRELSIVPSTTWGGSGLIGLSIRFCKLTGVNEHVWHVLDVYPNSPASRANLQPYDDYVVGAPKFLFTDSEYFFNLIQSNLDRPVELYVYNSRADDVRVVSITPTYSWGGDGILGCDVGYGLLHRIPTKPSEQAQPTAQARAHSHSHAHSHAQPQQQQQYVQQPQQFAQQPLQNLQAQGENKPTYEELTRQLSALQQQLNVGNNTTVATPNSPQLAPVTTTATTNIPITTQHVVPQATAQQVQVTPTQPTQSANSPISTPSTHTTPQNVTAPITPTAVTPTPTASQQSTSTPSTPEKNVAQPQTVLAQSPQTSSPQQQQQPTTGSGTTLSSLELLKQQQLALEQKLQALKAKK